MPTRQGPVQYDPEGITLVNFVFSGISAAYQVLAYHLPTGAVTRHRRNINERQSRNVTTLIAELEGLKADVRGIQAFLSDNIDAPLDAVRARYGASALFFPDAAKMREYFKLATRFLDRTRRIHWQVFAVLRGIGDTEERTWLAEYYRSQRAVIEQTSEAMEKAHFNSPNLRRTLDDATDAIDRINGFLRGLAEKYSGL